MNHREVNLVTFQDYPSNGVLYNGFGIEIHGADFNMYRQGRYRAWLRNPRSMVVELPSSRSTFMTEVGLTSYQAQRQRLGGHAATYETARLVARNRVLAQQARHTYFLLLAFPEEFELTNAVLSPNSVNGEIAAQITPVENAAQINPTRTVVGLEVDVAWAITIVEEEPRRVTAVAANNVQANDLDQAMDGMLFANP